MELKLTLQVIRRWARLLTIGVLVGGVIGYVINIYQTPEYEARDKILVMDPVRNSSGSTSSTLKANKEMADTYLELLFTQPILDATSQKVGATLRPAQIRADRVGETGLLQAIIRDRDPQRWRRTATDQVWAHLTRPSGSRAAAARSLLQLQDTPVADAVVMRLIHEPNQVRADVALATLRDLSRAAPDDLATASLSVWAHAAATRGDTPRALAAIHRAQKLTPRHHPTVVLRRLLIDGVDPTTLAAVHLPEAALLATPTGITPAVVSTNGGTDGPTPLPPTASPPPAPPHRPIR